MLRSFPTGFLSENPTRRPNDVEQRACLTDFDYSAGIVTYLEEANP